MQGRIEEEVARLRKRFPQITACHTALVQWTHDDAQAAIAAAGRMAHGRMQPASVSGTVDDEEVTA